MKVAVAQIAASQPNSEHLRLLGVLKNGLGLLGIEVQRSEVRFRRDQILQISASVERAVNRRFENFSHVISNLTIFVLAGERSSKSILIDLTEISN